MKFASFWHEHLYQPEYSSLMGKTLHKQSTPLNVNTTGNTIHQLWKDKEYMIPVKTSHHPKCDADDFLSPAGPAVWRPPLWRCCWQCCGRCWCGWSPVARAWLAPTSYWHHHRPSPRLAPGKYSVHWRERKKKQLDIVALIWYLSGDFRDLVILLKGTPTNVSVSVFGMATPKGLRHCL